MTRTLSSCPADTDAAYIGLTLAILDESAQQAKPDALRNGFLTATTFARFSANDNVDRAERATVAYVRDGKAPEYLRAQRRRTTDHLRTMTAAEVLAIRDDPPEMQITATMRVPGLGPVKSAFALSIAGFGKFACLDRHICRTYGLDAEAVNKLSTSSGFAAVRYLRYMEACYPPPADARLGQWLDFYERVPAFASSLHKPVIDLILACYRGEMRPEVWA